MAAGEMRQQVQHSLGRAHVSTGAIQSCKPDQDSGAFRADREDIQRTKGSVSSPRAGGAPAALGGTAGTRCWCSVALCHPARHRSLAGTGHGLVPEPPVQEAEQLCRAASIKQLELRLPSRLPKQQWSEQLLLSRSCSGTSGELAGPGAEQAAPCHGPEAAARPEPRTSP